jgi:hypothetical protein
MAWLILSFKTTVGLYFNFQKVQGARYKFAGIKLDLQINFINEIRRPGVWVLCTTGRWRSMVDQGWWRPRSSLERGLASGAPKLTAVTPNRRGGGGGSHRWLRWPAWRRGEAGGEEEQAAEVDLIIGRLGERRGGARSGKMFWGKWPWPRAPFIAPGLLAEGAGRRDGGSRWVEF